MSNLLFGVTTSPATLATVQSFLRERVASGTRVGVEYTAEHYANFFNMTEISPQDIFWREVIDFLKERKCKIVYLDSEKLRTEIDAVHKKGSLSLKDAEKVFSREQVFLRKIPSCQISVLGAAHAINLKQKTKSQLVLEHITSLMHEKGLIPLTPENLVNRTFSAKRFSAFETLLKANPVHSPNGNHKKGKLEEARRLIAMRKERLQRLADLEKKRKPNKPVKPKRSLK